MTTGSGGGDRARKLGPLRAAKTVFWAFFGVRRGRDQESDAENLTPVQIIVAGIIAAAMFVTVLIMLVRFITK